MLEVTLIVLWALWLSLMVLAIVFFSALIVEEVLYQRRQ